MPKVDENSNDSDRTQATSPEMQQSAVTPVDLPPPAVHGSGIRTGESIDPGAARVAAASVPDHQLDPPAEELLGTTYLGKYEILSVLGSGGMGVVYKGLHIFFEEIVAIKMLKSLPTSVSNEAKAKIRERFHKEAVAMRMLRHPGIVAITDFGVDDLDRPYMVMEHVEGTTLSDILKERGTLSMKDLLPVSLEICDALSELHHKGIVHRDLKPSNIILFVDDKNSVHVKLLDFGIAKMLDIQEQQSLTRTGEILGTPVYMSPEQIQGLREEMTHSSDLYSLGCMLYMCLTGTTPFIGHSKFKTMEKHCTAQPLPLKQACRGRDFPPGIEPIVMRLLEKKPEGIDLDRVRELRRLLDQPER